MTTKERPILFNGEMVRAIIGGRKTQTRRCVKPKFNNAGNYTHSGDIGSAIKQIEDWQFTDGRWFGLYGQLAAVYADCPYGQVGDLLWVRETFIQGWEANSWGDIDQYDESGNEKPIKTWYKADGHIDWEDADGEFCTNTPWKPSIHMPRSASRITLEITNVRIERLQDIGEEDAIAEGINAELCAKFSLNAPDRQELKLAAIHAYAGLWESINGSDSWDANPWVWVIEFRRIEE